MNGQLEDNYDVIQLKKGGMEKIKRGGQKLKLLRQ